MKTFKDLLVPEVLDYIVRGCSSQSSHCIRARCDEIDCGDCLFDDDHLKKFEEWLQSLKT